LSDQDDPALSLSHSTNDAVMRDRLQYGITKALEVNREIFVIFLNPFSRK
jgi:hypothetical protein